MKELFKKCYCIKGHYKVSDYMNSPHSIKYRMKNRHSYDVIEMNRTVKFGPEYNEWVNDVYGYAIDVDDMTFYYDHKQFKRYVLIDCKEIRKAKLEKIGKVGPNI